MAALFIPSSDVEEKLRIFKEQEESITILETQLADLRKQHAELREELGPYLLRNGISHAVQHFPDDKTNAPIYHCPDEILQMIFEEYLAPKHIRIKTLLLVCRQWYWLVMNTAKLWTRIQVHYSVELFDLMFRKSLCSYISACMVRSRGLPLDVTLWFPDLPTRSNYIKKEVEAFLEEIVDGNQVAQIERLVDELDLDLDCSRYEEQLHVVYDAVFGVNNSRVARWSSLTLIFPEDGALANCVWERLAVSTLNLTELELYTSTFLYHENPPLNLPILKSVKIHEMLPLSSFNLFPINLIHLDIDSSPDLPGIEDLTQFINLRTLKLSFWRSGVLLHSEVENPTRLLDLPRLSELILSGSVEPPNWLEFKLPALVNLTLEARLNIFTPPKLPAKHICWLIREKDKKTDYWASKSVDDLVSVSKTAQTITVQEFARSELLRVVARRLADSSAPSLTQLIVEHDNGWIERIAVQDVPNLVAMMEVGH